MKWIWFFLTLMLASSMSIGVSASSGPKAPTATIDVYEGRLFTGPQDPDYKDYDSALKNRLIKRIQQKYRVEFPPESYSGYDLLEIESLIRVKKPHEPLDPILKMFPKFP